MELTPGLDATVESAVADADTATGLGSGDVDVLATPRVVALCEAAAVKAVAGSLGDAQTSVGVHIDIQHLAPTPVGSTVTAHAELIEISGRTLRFTVTASDRSGEIAHGTHTRVVVDKAKFTQGAHAR
jgi:fluoroacetyl-CoA thioesterase